MNEKQKRNLIIGVAVAGALFLLWLFFNRGTGISPTVLAGASTGGSGINFPEFSFAGPAWGDSDFVIPELYQPGGLQYMPGVVPPSCMTMCCGTGIGYSGDENNFGMFFGA
jgi:hypothetical protein